MDTPIRLQVTPTEGRPFDYQLLSDSLVVGRALEADLTLSDPFLSLDRQGVPFADGRTLVLARRSQD